MKDVSSDGPVDWLTFPDPRDPDLSLCINMTFLTSNWQCQFGRGCPGLFGDASKHTAPDLGCCTSGFYTASKAEQDQINQDVAKLTPADWDDDMRKEYNRTGKWAHEIRPYKDGEEDTDLLGKVKSRVVNGGCIFANRMGGSTGKVGCAFLHLGNRLNGEKNDLTNNSEEHFDFMPKVCHQLPLRGRWDDDVSTYTVDAWSTNDWTGMVGEDGTNDYAVKWWCVDSPDAYTNSRMIVHSMKRELIDMIGEEAYAMVEQACVERANVTFPMPAIDAEHRDLLELSIKGQVGDRTPVRDWPGF